VVDRLGKGVSVSMERVAAKFGQMLGPMLMGALFAQQLPTEVLGWLGNAIVIFSLLLLLCGRLILAKPKQDLC